MAALRIRAAVQGIDIHVDERSQPTDQEEDNVQNASSQVTFESEESQNEIPFRRATVNRSLASDLGSNIEPATVSRFSQITEQRGPTDSRGAEFNVDSLRSTKTSGFGPKRVPQKPKGKGRTDLEVTKIKDRTAFKTNNLSATLRGVNQQQVAQKSTNSRESHLGLSLGTKPKSNIVKYNAASFRGAIMPRLPAKIAPQPPMKNFVYGIIDYSNAYGRISGENHATLKDALNNSLARSMLDTPNICPVQITNSEFIEGIFVISISSKDCVIKLRDLVGKLPPLWPGAKLRFVSEMVVPLLTTAAFCVRCFGARRSTGEILRIIALQNPKLTVDLWQIYRRVDVEDGDFFVVGLNPSSVAYLKTTKGQMFFLTSTIEVVMDTKILCEYTIKELQRNRCLAKSVLTPRPISRRFDSAVRDIMKTNQVPKQETEEEYWDYYFLKESAKLLLDD